ncbi:bifunctional folylpolyglutamate synthase/dihydrofolate synthase [Bosea sp. PAMC 26642]|uniref:bifunctional folylpolyglutamate synthase/dihydrofolate synthase n=1 Tax=Bosea sp. (strain PAMC 26642) TaxID=1792307 RepID=UPI0007700FAA|nr:folylpolyglutamate synthase/dihydrofolate synthase family protein [Bosea sp. PAMC 26642]AMJ62350.1 bifunctional folylpolyglutamate synthase/dihydrofolate synthase [Bosea sp. PAMC 26642]
MSSSDTLLARFLALHPKLIDLSLGRSLRLLERLGDPHKRLPPVIHVAGTNGKGSTIAFMRAILEAAGLSVHVYTSPHLVRFHERIRLGATGGGRFVDEAVLVEALQRCESANAGEPITFYEITTAAAFLLFVEHPADVVLLETGLGGRLDTTNVIAHPACTVVTPISLDHAEYLGDTVTKIAAEKAGIFKRGAPAVIAPQEPEPTAVLEATAERVGASKILIGAQDFNVHEDGGRLVYEDGEGLLDLPLPRLAGRHQHVNAGTAIAALRAAGYGGLPARAFEQGMLTADWPARLQRLPRGKLVELVPPRAELWLDGGHNPDGGRVLAQAMADLADRNPAPLAMIVGLLSTKDARATLAHFKGLAQALFAVPIQNSLAARPAEEVAMLAREVGLQAEISGSVEQALREIGARNWTAPPRILICGSLYLAGEVLSANGTLPV